MSKRQLLSFRCIAQMLAASPFTAIPVAPADAASPAVRPKAADMRGEGDTTSLLPSAPTKVARVESLDQFRGMVIFQSLIVPVVGGFEAGPAVFKHNNTFFSLADSTLPLFYVAIGFAMELTLTRLVAREGRKALVLKQLRRSRNLFLIGMILYKFDSFQSYDGADGLQESWPNIFKNLYGDGYGFYQSINMIAIAQLVMLPGIGRPVMFRLAYALVLGVIYMFCLYGFWMQRLWKYIDGGLLAALLSYPVLMLIGSALSDWVKWTRGAISDAEHLGRQAALRAIRRHLAVLLGCACGLMTAGYLLSLPSQSLSPACFQASPQRVQIPCMDHGQPSLPFTVPPVDSISMWTMSQRSASMSLQLFASGYAITYFAVIHVISDVLGYKSRVLAALSQRSILMYILRDYGFSFASAIFPSDSPPGIVVPAVLTAFATNMLILRALVTNNITLQI